MGGKQSKKAHPVVRLRVLLEADVVLQAVSVSEARRLRKQIDLDAAVASELNDLATSIPSLTVEPDTTFTITSVDPAGRGEGGGEVFHHLVRDHGRLVLPGEEAMVAHLREHLIWQKAQVEDRFHAHEASERERLHDFGE